MKIPRGLNLFHRKNDDSPEEKEDGRMPSSDIATVSDGVKSGAERKNDTRPIDRQNVASAKPNSVSSPIKSSASKVARPDLQAKPQMAELKPEQPKPTVLAPDELEELWYELENDPNNEKMLARMLSHCRNTKGPAAVNAALLALSEQEEAYLPQILLAKIDLAGNRLYEALDYYQRLIDDGKTSDFVLLRMSADLGRLGFPDEMIRLVAPVYDPKSHSPYIGLNLLRAYKITGNHQGGSKLFADLQDQEDSAIQSALAPFENAFFTVREPESEPSCEAALSAEDVPLTDDVAATVASSPPAEEDASDSEETVVSKDINQTDTTDSDTKTNVNTSVMADDLCKSADSVGMFLPRPLMLRIPVWREFIPVLEDILPETDRGPRIGLLQYTDATSSGADGGEEMGEMFRVLSGGIPLLLAEQLLFSAPVSPMVLFPPSQIQSSDTSASEPDVDRLFEVCARESLDYLITGTITKQAEMVTIRSWMLDRSKKSARIVSQSAPLLALSEGLDAHGKELTALFEDKSYTIEVKRKGFVYSFPKPDTFFKQATALFRLSMRLLYAQGRYNDVQLDDSEDLLEVMADLCRMKPLSQNYLMMLLAGMIADRELDGVSYRNYRDLIYQNAQKMQYTACITSTRKTIERVLRD